MQIDRGAVHLKIGPVHREPVFLAQREVLAVLRHTDYRHWLAQLGLRVTKRVSYGILIAEQPARQILVQDGYVRCAIAIGGQEVAPAQRNSHRAEIIWRHGIVVEPETD